MAMYWNKHEAASAWGVSVRWAAVLMQRYGAKKIVDGRAQWCIPQGFPKPTSNAKTRRDKS